VEGKRCLCGDDDFLGAYRTKWSHDVDE
jgi:hypothetical protein